MTTGDHPFLNSSEHHVASTVQALKSAVSALWKMRIDPQTSQLVANSEGDLWASLGTLREMVSDIRAERDAA